MGGGEGGSTGSGRGEGGSTGSGRGGGSTGSGREGRGQCRYICTHIHTAEPG